MCSRNDAGLAAAELALSVEKHVLDTRSVDTVGTTGMFYSIASWSNRVFASLLHLLTYCTVLLCIVITLPQCGKYKQFFILWFMSYLQDPTLVQTRRIGEENFVLQMIKFVA